MKLHRILIIVVVLVLNVSMFATQLNGRVVILNNDGSNYKVLLQLNTDLENQKMGGATFVIGYDTTVLNFPDSPESGIDYIFSNFNLGFYDTAKVTKVAAGRVWLNIDLTSDGHGTLIQKGPDEWTDLAILNFTSNNSIQNRAITWRINNRFWGVYDSDNLTQWDNGNFDFITSVENIGNQIGDGISYQLSQNYPNPFNPTTKIGYYIPEKSFVQLVVYNTIGQQIGILVSEEKEAGSYSFEFNASGLPSGVYIYRFAAGSFVQIRKMVLLK